jgi:serine/threonine-protein phosphatase PGAM5
VPHKVKRSYGDVWLRYPTETLPVRTLYLVRHGHYQMKEPWCLTRLGVRQAERLAKRLSRERLDMIHYSTLSRARETALIIARYHPDVPTRPGSLLWEVRPPFMKPGRPPKGDHDRWRRIRDEMRDEEQRLTRIYDRFLKPAKKERTELIVCHGNVIRSIAVKVLKMKRQPEVPLLTRNAALTEIRVSADGRVMLCRYDDVGHLPPGMLSVT